MAKKPDATIDQPNAEFGDIPVVDPGGVEDSASTPAGGDGSDGGSVKRRRRRTREEIERDNASSGGSEIRGRASSQTQIKANIETTTAVLISIHHMLAGITGHQELVLREDEAKSFAAAIAHVQSFYPSKANAKMVAWANLGMIAGVVYGPRLITIINKQKLQPRAVTNNSPQVAPYGFSAA